jgi:hypothetical protein
MSNEVTTTAESSAPALLATGPGFDLSPKSLEEALKLADYLADSSIVPKDFQGKPGNVLVAIQWGLEIGLKPMQAMQNIAVINGRPSLWGDAVLALVLASPVCKDVIERYEGTPGADDYTAVCIAQRHGKEDKVGRFSIKDARAASLLDKPGPWKQYRDRMLKMRARAFALRDQFTDVLKGIPIAEEVMDIPVERDITPPRTAAEFAQQAKPQPSAAVDRDALLDRLDKIVRSNAPAEKRLADLAKAWNDIGRDGRVAVGADELKRLQAIAGAVDAQTNTPSEQPQGEAGNPAQGAATAGPAPQEEGDDNPFEGA